MLVTCVEVVHRLSPLVDISSYTLSIAFKPIEFLASQLGSFKGLSVCMNLGLSSTVKVMELINEVIIEWFGLEKTLKII